MLRVLRSVAQDYSELAVQVSDWDAPGLGEWSVRELVGHTLGGLARIEQYRSVPVDASAHVIESAAEYYRISFALPGVHEQVATRGREAGIALGADPVDHVADEIERILGSLSADPLPITIATLVGPMQTEAYLATRICELVVHGDDLCRATGLVWNPSEDASMVAMNCVFSLGSHELRASVLAAVLGRGDFPAPTNIFA